VIVAACAVVVIDFITQKSPRVIPYIHTTNDDRGSEEVALSLIIATIT
jgi:hypothetical protein